MQDTMLKKTIASLPQLPQRQYDTRQQLLYLSMAAVKLGLYDADDLIKAIIGNRQENHRYSLYNNKGEHV